MRNSLPIILLLALFMHGCSSGPATQEIANQTPELTATDSTHHTEDASEESELSQQIRDLSQRDYRIGAGDVIKLYAPNIDEIADEYTIGPDGKISVPYVGVIDLKDHTRSEASQKINDKLKEDYLDPNVDVIVEEYNNNRVFVLGEVRMPGEYNFASRPNLLGALSRAQGLTHEADLRGCSIIRGRGTLIEVSLYDLLRRGNRQLNIALLPGDTVYVKNEEDNRFYVLGEVNNAGAFPRTEEVDIVKAVSEAGGFTEDARLEDVRIIRRDAQGKNPRAIKYDLRELLKARGDISTPKVQKADIVYVPRRGLASFNYVLRQITPSLNLLLLTETLTDSLDSN